MTEVGRDVTSIVPMMTLEYVERALGHEAAVEVLRRSGTPAGDPSVASEHEWCSVERAAAIAAAAADLCGDAEVGERIAEQYFLHHRDNGVQNFLLGEGSPEAAVVLAVQFASRMSNLRQFHVRDRTSTSVRVEGLPGTVAGPSRFFCHMAGAYWARIPALFGADGSTVHRRCIDRGDPVCEYVVAWTAPAVLGGGEAERRRGVADEAIARFEDLQAMSGELTSADDLHTLLERVVRRLSLAVLAPQFLITVQPRQGDAVELAAVGFDDDAATTEAAALWGLGPSGHSGVVLRAPIESAHRLYGHLAAYLPADAVELDMDERLLHAYAGHATAAIERTVSIEDARRSHQATDALLRLAGSLAAATSVREVCTRLAAAIPDVTECDVGAVWLWDEAGRQLILEGGTSDALTPGIALGADRIGGLLDLAGAPEPRLIDGSREPVVRSILDAWNLSEGYAAPILLRGRFLGLITAATTASPKSEVARAWVLERLGALADHGSTALDSSMLLEHIRHQALHDSLTGLPNRALAETRAREALDEAREQGDGVAFLFVDLDRFKNVNDTLGHSAGDELIRLVAERLAACVGDRGTVARLGGDEFFVLVPGAHASATGVALADAIIEAVRRPFEIAGQPLFISASVGIACFPDHGTDDRTLMSHADAAMYQAKAYGRSTYAVHADELTGERHARLQLESELHLAVERDELVVLYQPQVDLRTGGVVGVEALVRWQHPERGLLGPDAFLAIAEDSGVIVAIDEWVRREAMAQARRWCDAGLVVNVALNLSTRDLRNPEIADDIAAAIAAAGVHPGLIELEITDRVVMSSDDLPAVMGRLHDVGVRLAIDDFGTGNSVLSRLQHCPVDVLKIDRTFISELTDDSADARLVNALVTMAHALGLRVVGEGIETEEQAAILRRFGCDLGQGFLFSRPVPAARIADLLSGTTGRRAAATT